MLETALALAATAAKQVAQLGADRIVTYIEQPLTEALPALKHLPVIREVQLRRAVPALEERVRRIELTQEGDRLLGFANMCFRYFEVGSKEHRDTKLRILAAACAHCASADNTDSFDEELEFFDAVERLQPFHFYVLNFLHAHHTTGDPEGKHDHPMDASYKELREEQLLFPEPEDLWLTKALTTLWNIAAIRVQQGSGFELDERGYAQWVVDPERLVQDGKIGLAPFGCKLLRYVEDALEDPQDDG